MKVRREDVETSHSPFSSAVPPSREIDGLFRIWRLPGICYGAILDYKFRGIDFNLAFLHIMVSSVVKSFYQVSRYSHTMC